MEEPRTASRIVEGRPASSASPLFEQVISRPGSMALRNPERFAAELKLDLAHTVMLAERGIISREDAAAICAALLKAVEKGPEAIPIDPSRGSTLLQVDAYLAQEVGQDLAGRINLGRSRTDRELCIMRLPVRHHLLQVVEALVRWQEALLSKGEEHADSVMPSFTHMHPTHPITFGYHLLAQFWLHLDDLERLELAYRHTNVNSLGTAYTAGTSWPIDRERTQELLGFDCCTENARVSRSFTYRAGIVSAYATLMATLHSLASDLYVWSSRQFSIVEPADEHSGIGSIMPQKRHAYVWERTRSAARHAAGWTSSALATLMGASSSDSWLEPAEVERYGPVLADLLRLNAETLLALKVDKGRMLQLAREDYLSTGDQLVDVLVRERGLPFHKARQVVASLTGLCLQEGLTHDAVESELLDRAAVEVDAAPPKMGTKALREALDPVCFVRSRVSRGGASPDDVRRQARLGREALDGHKGWLREAQDSLAEADAKLKRAVASLTS